MSVHPSVEVKIREVMYELMLKGMDISTSVAQIKSFPVRNYEDLFKEGRFSMSRFSMDFDSAFFDPFATKSERVIFVITSVVFTYGAFMIGIVLAIFVSWWCLFFCLFLFVGVSLSKKIYNGVVLRAAAQSEIVFCFLYFFRQIAIQDNTDKTLFYRVES